MRYFIRAQHDFLTLILILIYFQRHLATCNFEKELCPNDGCSEKVMKGDMEKHLKEQCPYRVVKCKYCEKTFSGHEFKVRKIASFYFSVLVNFNVVRKFGCKSFR